MKRLIILSALLVLTSYMSTSCAPPKVIEAQPTVPPGNVEALKVGWERICDGFRYTAHREDVFLCANSFSFAYAPGYIRLFADVSGNNFLCDWKCTEKSPVTLINAEGAVFICDK